MKLLIFQTKKTTDLTVKTWGGIKDMLSPPMSKHGGYIPPIPPGFTPLLYHIIGLYLNCIHIIWMLKL